MSGGICRLLSGVYKVSGVVHRASSGVCMVSGWICTLSCGTQDTVQIPPGP